MTAGAERDLGVARAAIAGTRRDLAVRVRRLATLGTPSRLSALAAASARETAATKAWQVGERVVGAAATRGRRAGAAAGLVSLIAPLAFFALRRGRANAAPRRRASSMTRRGATSLLSLVLSVAACYARHRR